MPSVEIDYAGRDRTHTHEGPHLLLYYGDVVLKVLLYIDAIAF